MFFFFFFFLLKNLVFIFESNKLSEDIKVSKLRCGLSLDKRNVLMNYLVMSINRFLDCFDQIFQCIYHNLFKFD